MNTATIERLSQDEQRLTQMMKALGNPTRMWIMRYLTENPQCITGDIVAATRWRRRPSRSI